MNDLVVVKTFIVKSKSKLCKHHNRYFYTIKHKNIKMYIHDLIENYHLTVCRKYIYINTNKPEIFYACIIKKRNNKSIYEKLKNVIRLKIE